MGCTEGLLRIEAAAKFEISHLQAMHYAAAGKGNILRSVDSKAAESSNLPDHPCSCFMRM
jgi:hypothetical protein